MEEEILENEKLEFDVTMTDSILYDYQIYNSYCKSSNGMIGTCIGTLAIILGLAYNYVIFIIMGVVLVLYTPISLKLRCKTVVANNKAFKEPLHYVFDETGITVSQGEDSQSAAWENMYRAVSTKQSIIVYTAKKLAWVFPRKQLGPKLPQLIATISRYMEPSKVRIRF
jgi:hypothetical protein